MYLFDFDTEINDLLYGNNDYGSSNLFPSEDGTCCGIISKEPFSFNNSYKENEFDDYFQNEERIFNDNEQKRGILSNDDTTNLEKKEYFSLVLNKNETKASRETNLTELISNKPKIKNIFVVKKEISTTPKDIKRINDTPPEFFDEKSINDIIEKFFIIEDKSKVLLDMVIKNHEIIKLRQILESNFIKRRKKIYDISLRYDHILSKLINIINLLILDFINNLINAIYSKEELNQIIEGLNLSTKISGKDLVQIIKKNDYEYKKNLIRIDSILGFLKLTMKKYLSDSISKKYDSSKYSSNYNELILGKILEDENNKEIFEFVFNDLTVLDWLELFLYKKQFEDFKTYNAFNIYKKNKIKGSLKGIDKYNNKIKKRGKNEKDTKIHYHLFFLISYNLKRFLLNKETRPRKKEETKEEAKKEN